MDMSNKAALLSILIVGALFLFTMAGGHVPRQERLNSLYTNVDVEITKFTWIACKTPGEFECNFPPIFRSLDGGLKGQGDLYVYSREKKIYMKVYVDDIPLTIDYSQGPVELERGENKFHIKDIPLHSFSGDITFKACFSRSGEFNKDEVCKKKTFHLPRISLSVEPSTIVFNVSKEDFETPRKNITITNTGEIPLDVSVMLPSAVGIEGYPTYYPQYLTYGFVLFPDLETGAMKSSWGGTTSVLLLPGKSALYDISVSVGNQGEYDVQPGTYTSEGYVYTFWVDGYIDALYKKSFSLTTIVR